MPAGVVNVVPCSRERVEEVGAALCASPRVQVLSFTGSTAVGKVIKRFFFHEPASGLFLWTVQDVSDCISKGSNIRY